MDGVSYNIEQVSVSMAKAMAVGAEIKVIGADKPLWDGADGVWQETTILDVRGAEVGVLQRTTDGVTVRYESGDPENFAFEGDGGFNDFEALYFASLVTTPKPPEAQADAGADADLQPPQPTIERAKIPTPFRNVDYSPSEGSARSLVLPGPFAGIDGAGAKWLHFPLIKRSSHDATPSAPLLRVDEMMRSQ